MKKFFIFLQLLVSVYAQAQLLRLQEKNVHSFSKRTQILSPELLKLPDNYHAHPEFGILPFTTPPDTNCVELIDRRDAYSRYFVEKGSGGSHFYQQKSYSAINFQDGDGRWREINFRLEADSQHQGLFSAANQPTPFQLDVKGHFAKVQANGKQLVFNKELVLFHLDEHGMAHELGTPDWSDYSAGDEGLRIFDFYPGIDLLFTFETGSMETSFILKRPCQFSGGYLVMKQQLDLSEGMKYLNVPEGDYGRHQDLYIGTEENVPYFTIEKCFAYDNGGTPQRKNLSVKITDDNSLYVFTPMEWLTDSATVYPVLIDPVVTTQNSLAAGAIAGTKFSPVCWTNGCDYFLTVPTPANTRITNIYASFEYFAGGACFAQDGGFNIDFSSCVYPSAATGVITCPFAVSNFNCGIVNASTLPDFTSCLPPPQCASQNLDFTLHFYRCNNDPSLTCGNSCISASQPWIMTIEGRTMEMIYNSPLQVICAGDSVNVVTIAQSGVGPYQYVWSPLAANNDTIRVAPSMTTNYTVTVTDACGTTSSGTSSVQVTPFNNPGFSISPNPVCMGQPVTLFGFGAGAASAYDWTMPGSNAPGGIITDSKSPIIQYAVGGVYPITLRYTSSSCVFDSTLDITVDAPVAAQVNLSAFPAGAICPGDTLHLFAAPTNGGTAPQYDWYIDGLLVQSGSLDSLQSNNFVNGSLVQVVLTSNSSCANPLIDTAAVFVVFSTAVNTAVSIVPDSSICPGALVTFSAGPVNGGVSPTYQWSINGIAVAGAVSNTFTTVVSSLDSIIRVDMLSSLTCVVNPNASDTLHVSFETPITPMVTLSPIPSGAVCAGDTIVFTAQTNGGGANPAYQWFLNGVSLGPAGSDSTFQLTSPVQNDSVRVVLLSSHNCLLSNSVEASSMVTVTASAIPAVALSASPSLFVCQGDTVIFTASGTSLGAQAVFHWYLNNVLQTESDSMFSIVSLNDQDIIRVEAISSLSCALLPSDTDSVIINVSPISNPSVTIVESGSGACVGDLIQWTASSVNGGSSPVFDWMVNGIAQGINSTTFSYAAQDGDTIQSSLSSNSVCALSPVAQSNRLLVHLLPYVTPAVTIHANPSDTICPGQDVILTAFTQNGGSSPVYQWTVNGIQVGNNSPVLNSTAFQLGDMIQLNMSSNAPCLNQPNAMSNFIRILSYPPLSVQLTGTGNLCPGTPVMLIATANGGDGGPYFYFWNHSVENNDTLLVTPESTSRYFVHVQDQCGSTEATDSLLLTVMNGPVSAFTYSPEDPSTFNNNVYFPNLSLNALNWVWTFSDSTISYELNPVHRFDSAGTYSVSLISTAANGCTDTVYYTIVVKEDIAVFFPGAFSPNGDHLNEIWFPVGASLTSYKFSIWDRWGQLIFEGDQTRPWDGHVNASGIPAQEGVYLFRVDLMDSKFEKQVITGRVTLIR